MTNITHQHNNQKWHFFSIEIYASQLIRDHIVYIPPSVKEITTKKFEPKLPIQIDLTMLVSKQGS
jgi:hypothetical protein